MQPNHVIESKEDLLNHFVSSQKLEIGNLQQMERFLKMNIPPKVWKDAQNRNLLFFSLEFVQGTKELTFSGRKIEDVYLISFLTNLTELNLQNNKIYDIFSISKLKNLKKLYLNNNYIKDISALQFLPNLTYLKLNENSITSYKLVLPNLVALSLSYNKIQDKSGLQYSTKLQSLYLFNTETTDLCTIPHQLFGLKELDLQMNSLTEISYLSNFLDLQFLDLGYNKQLKNIEPLKFCTQHTELRIHQTSVSDIWPLQFMKNLKTLYMNDTEVIDLHPLQHLYKLEKIYSESARIIDVSPLSKLNLTQLKCLTLNNNKINNAKILKIQLNFSKYSLSGQNVPTADELKFYNKILSIHCSHEQIRNIQIENRVSKFKESVTRQREYVNLQINEQIQLTNKKIEIWAQFIQNSNADQ
ncbi:Conserved_hypothetical protein [Hexamita inflata]|uniref:Leucine rich repeat protein n=1 Tax=Hexamita inflata TaxID=28002 RepID=A0ABP1HB86_9EUKA